MARQMKDSGIEWIGEIPQTWNIRKGKWILEHLERPVLPDDGVITCFRDGEVTLRSNRREDGFTFSLQEAGYQGIEPGDLVVHGMDGFAGAIGISDSRGKGTPVLNVLDSTENKRYLTYYLRTMAHNGIFLALSTGIRVRSCDTNWNKLKELQYILPPSDEQERIVVFLDRKCAEIDAVIERTKATIEEYKKLKQAVITEAVTKGVRGPRHMKDSGIEWIGEIPEEWSVGSIKYGVTKVGSGKTPLGGADSYADEGILFLRSQNVYDTGLLLDSPTYITSDVDEEMSNTRVYPGDVLLNITGGSIGRCCIFPEEQKRANVNQHVCIIRVITNVFTPEYMHYYWISALGHTVIDMYQTGGNREGMSADAIKNAPIIYMSLAEQAEITAYLDEKCAALDTLITKKTALLTELETYKKSLIYEYVTGKKECPEAVAQVAVAVEYPYFPAAVKTKKLRFAQAMMMAKILDVHGKSMGRVKLEKMLYTIETSIGFDFDTEYVREAAGPLHESIYKCEGIISRQNHWYQLNQSQYGVSYMPTKDAGKYRAYYDKYFSAYNAEIERIIGIFKPYNTDQAEVIATLFAAWNDAIIDGKTFTDEDIVDDVLNNWHDNKQRFPRDMWLRAMGEMRKNNLIPNGYGKKTVRRTAE